MDTYGFNSNIKYTAIDGSQQSLTMYDFAVNTTPIVTLYNYGTNNKLDLSGYSSASTIDLNDGMFSSAHGMKNNIFIEYGTTIDSVTGGSGDDSFTVNNVSDTIDGGGGTNTVVLAGNRALYAEGLNGSTYTLTSAGVTYSLTNIQTVKFADQTVAATSLACFSSGTLILTGSGLAAVEDLRVGDQVVIASGGTQPIIWLGHRRLDVRRHPRPQDVMPVRVQAGAFGAAPARDLYLSPDHAVFVDGVLVPVRYLINGATIRQETVHSVTYWHVELAAHSVILAEGLPCESYLDTGNRNAFVEGGCALALHPDFALKIWEAAACAKLVTDGAELEAARSFLLHQATILGHRITDDADLHLLANGRIVWPEIEGPVHRFALPNGAAAVCIRSRHGVPAEMLDANSDHRRLGVAVSALRVDSVAQDLAAMAGQGWHAAEDGWRWTDGNAMIDVAGAQYLTVTVMTAARSWQSDHTAPAERRVAPPAWT